MEKIDGRLDLLESTRTDQAELQNSLLPLEREASVCHPAFEEERLEYFDRLSVTASPDHILDDSSPNVDNHDGHRVAPMTSKSLDPVQNVNEDEASMPQSQHGEQSRLEDGISEKPRLYNPTAESPGWAPSDSFKEFLNSNFRRNLSSSQVFKVLEETALPDMDIFVTPKLDKSLADQISPNYRKTAENRDRKLSKVQRHILNTAAPLTVLHDLLENKQSVSHEEILATGEIMQPVPLIFRNTRQKKRKISPINPRNEQIRPWGKQRQISPTRQPTTALSEQQQRFPLTGRLRFFYNNWKSITLDPSILDIVLGYKIVFQTHPFQLTVPRSTTQNPCLIDKEVKCLLNKSAIVQVPYSKHAFYHRMFLVEKKNGGYRPVLDLSPLNTFIETTHFKMENLATLKSLINPGDYMINIDLTDAYLSVPIHQESRKFLRFIWQNKAY